MVTSLLPPSSTPLERAIEKTIANVLSGNQANALLRLKSAPPDAVVPWLAAEWFLADFIGYFPNARALIAAGLPWLKVRGTASAVKQALAWIGMSATLEEDGARLQLDPGSASAPANLAAIKHLVGASVPAHVQLYRLYHGNDRRVLHASSGDCWSDAFLSDDSGVWIDGVKLSFGRSLLLAAARPDTPAMLRLHRLHALRALYPDILRWGTFAFGDAPVRNHPVMHGRLVGLGNRVALRDPVSLTGRRCMARAAVPLSEDARLGEPNTRFGGYAETSVNRFFWSDPGSTLSAFDPGRIRTPIDEVFIATHRLSGVAGQSVRAAVSRHALHASGADWRGQVRLDGTLHWSGEPLTETTGALAVTRQHAGHCVGIGERAGRYGWSGGWDNRRWGGDLALTHQTQTS